MRPIYLIATALVLAACGVALPLALMALVRRSPARLAYWQVVLAVCLALPAVQPWRQLTVLVSPEPVAAAAIGAAGSTSAGPARVTPGSTPSRLWKNFMDATVHTNFRLGRSRRIAGLRRGLAVGKEDRAATTDELAKMKALVADRPTVIQLAMDRRWTGVDATP